MSRPEMDPDAVLDWLWLARVLGPGNPAAGRVLDQFHDARSAWEARETEAFRVLVGATAALRARDPQNAPETFRAFTRRCMEQNICILPYDDPDYPLAIARIADVPPVLYCTGNPQWLNQALAVGMVGSRRPTLYGQQAAEIFGRELARSGAVLVSGLADGLDSACHWAAVRENAPTIGVQGVPIDRVYPAANRELRWKIEQKGCVISEYPPESEVLGKNSFLLRNRLIAALSKVLIVVEAQEKSGSMSTVAHAERYGKTVFAVPGNITSPNSMGTNALIEEQRARILLRDMKGLFREIGLHPAVQSETKKASVPLTENEQKVLACLDLQTPKGIEELSVQSGLPSQTLSALLMKLELSRRVFCAPGKRYILSGSAEN